MVNRRLYFRKVRVSDLPQIIELSEKAVKEVGRIFYDGSPAYKIAEAVNNYSQVCTSGGKIVGFHLINKTGEKSFAGDGAVVDCQFRGQGIHKKLIGNAIKACQNDLPHFTLTVTTHPGNKVSFQNYINYKFKISEQIGIGDMLRNKLIYMQ